MTSAFSPYYPSDRETVGIKSQSVAVQAWAEHQQWRVESARPITGKPLRHADAACEWLLSQAITFRSPTRSYLRWAERVLAEESKLRELGRDALRLEVDRCRTRSRLGRLHRPSDRVQALAVVREAGRRAMGLNAYREQMAAVWALLDGRMTEMATGEGKSLVAALAATIVGWRGRGCHVVTVNDYLARRDMKAACPLFDMCGLGAACVISQTASHERAAAYAADVTYTTHQNAAADYLRDQLTGNGDSGGRGLTMPAALARQLVQGLHHARGSGRPPCNDSVGSDATGKGGTVGNEGGGAKVMRGLEAALIDEADSVLLDEASTPLIIAGTSDDPARKEAYAAAATWTDQFLMERHFQLDHRHRDLRLTPQGRAKVDQLSGEYPTAFSSGHNARRVSYEMMHQALSARHLYHRGDHYVVQDGKIVIVDAATGRLMPDRTWQAGLHQALEAKERVEIRGLQTTLASISFQCFFRNYRHLAGLTGTAWSDRAELWRTYRLRTIAIPTHRPCRRRQVTLRPQRDLEAKWAAVVEATRRYHDHGQPVLIGTRSVQDSDALSGKLTAARIPHDVLNARMHEREAEIVAGAGLPGRVTVATNVAGRGTDIKLGPGVAEKGGLVVIATDRHDSPRVDRQLQGRAARQGEPGFALALTSLQDPLLQRYARRLSCLYRMAYGLTPTWMMDRMIRQAQRAASRTAAQQRRQVQLRDEHLAEQLGT